VACIANIIEQVLSDGKEKREKGRAAMLNVEVRERKRSKWLPFDNLIRSVKDL